MNRPEIVSRLAGKTGMTHNNCNLFIDSFLEVITESVAGGEPVRFIGFGAFERYRRKERIGRNPKTGEEAVITSIMIPRFKPGKGFCDAVAFKDELADRSANLEEK